MKLSSAVAIGLMFVGSLASASDWKPLVDGVEYSPTSMTITNEQGKGAPREKVAVWIRFKPAGGSGFARFKIVGTCNDRTFHAVQASIPDVDGTDKEASGFSRFSDEPGTFSGAVVAEVCTLSKSRRRVR